MSEKKYVVLFDLHLLAKHLSARDACLVAARHGGWGAEFATNDQGRMALRRSPTVIAAGQHWEPTGQEPSVLGRCVSTKEMTKTDAIATLAEGLIPFLVALDHKLAVIEEDTYIHDQLLAAIREFKGDKGPGTWAAGWCSHAQMRKRSLSYQLPQGQSIEKDPFEHFGGLAILGMAGLRPHQILQGNRDAMVSI
jgi:hypothetical protein